MKPFIKAYVNEVLLKSDVNKLQAKGVAKDDIYILTHDNQRTGRLADNTDTNTIGMSEMDFSTAVGNMFNSQGDELRNKLEDMGLSEAESYEKELDDGKILLIVTNNDYVENVLF